MTEALKKCQAAKPEAPISFATPLLHHLPLASVQALAVELRTMAEGVRSAMRADRYGRIGPGASRYLGGVADGLSTGAHVAQALVDGAVEAEAPPDDDAIALEQRR